MADIAGWPHWEIQFDRAGNTAAAARAALLDQIAAAGLSDLIFMSHGWNSDIAHARRLYNQWFGMLPPMLPGGSAAKPGTVGVFWPSMLWPDEPAPAAAAGGGAAGLPEPAAASGTPGAPVAALAAVYPDPGQQQILSQLAALLDAQSPDPQALTQFHDLMRALGGTEPETIGLEDSGQLAMLSEDPQALAARFAAALDTASAPAASGGAAGGRIGNTGRGRCRGPAGHHAGRQRQWQRPGRRGRDRRHHRAAVGRGQGGPPAVHLLADEATRRDGRPAGPRPVPGRPGRPGAGPAGAPDRPQLRRPPRIVLARGPARRPAVAGAVAHLARRRLLAFRVRARAAPGPGPVRRPARHDGPGRRAAAVVPLHRTTWPSGSSTRWRR